MPRKSHSAKIGKFINVVYAKPLLTNREQRNTKNENPSPRFGGGIYRFSFFVNVLGTTCNIMWITTVICKLLNKGEKER